MKKILFRILVLILGLVFLYSAYNLYKIFREYKSNEIIYNEISNIVKKDDTEISISNEEYIKLKSINDDYIFWLYIPNTNINYPVVKSENNEEYLYKNFKGEENRGGSIFLDANNSLEDDNIIIHGHNMKDKSMFGTLSNLLKSDYLKSNKKIYIYLENKVLEYEIFSSYITEGETFPYKTNFYTNNEFNDYVNLVMSKSFYELDYFEDGKRNIITLSTCTNAVGDERTIVNAKLKNVYEY